MQKCAKYKCCAGRFRFVSTFFFLHRNENQRRCRRRCRFSVQFELPSNFRFFAPHFNLRNISTGAKPILIRQFLIIILSIFQLWIVYYPFEKSRENLTRKFSNRKKKHLLHHDTFHDASHKTFDTWFAQRKSEWQKIQSVNPHNDYHIISTFGKHFCHELRLQLEKLLWFFRLWFYDFWHLSLNASNGKFVVLGNLLNFVINIMIVKFYIFPFRIVIFLITQISNFSSLSSS